MDADEKRISQEDCNEDSLGVGILTLTNKRVAFDKKESRVMDFTAKIGDTVLNVPLENVTKVWKEGLLMKKICCMNSVSGCSVTIKGVNNLKANWFITSLAGCPYWFCSPHETGQTICGQKPSNASIVKLCLEP